MEASLTVLMFHSISNQNTSLCYSPDKFEELLLWLKKYNYNFIDISKIDNITRHSVILTFDDGYLDNFEILLPIIKKYNIPIVIYVATDFLDSTFTDSSGINYKMLSKVNLINLSNDPFVTIGAHTVSHKNLDELSSEDQYYEIVESKKLLEKHIRKEVTNFAYPRGKFNSKSIEILKNNGFKTAVTVESGNYTKINTIDKFLIKRVNVNSNFTILKLKLYTSNYVNMYIKLKRIARDTISSLSKSM